MCYKIIQAGQWFNVVIDSDDVVHNGIQIDGFNNREDAERYMAHLEAEDSKHALGENNV